VKLHETNFGTIFCAANISILLLKLINFEGTKSSTINRTYNN